MDEDNHDISVSFFFGWMLRIAMIVFRFLWSRIMLHTIINTFLLSSIDRELYSNNISGPIPSELGNLTNLVSLDLYLNSFSGPIPESLGKLSKLRFLYVYQSFI